MQSTSAMLSPSRADVLPFGFVLARRYELVKELGRGGNAIVYEALDQRLRRRVAVKLPLARTDDEAKLRRFAREARVLSAIHHPNICAVVDAGTTESGTPFLVLERIFGETLRSTLLRYGQLTLIDGLDVGLQLLSALDAVHSAGVVHRDVKPDNVLLVGRRGCEPIVKLFDFGLCRRITSEHGDDQALTIDGRIIGTPEYMAPEQILGRSTLDVRTDLYAFGVVLYEILTGDRAFYSKSVDAILSGVMSKRVRPLRVLRPDAPAMLEAIIARAMERDARRRYPTARELQEDLKAVRAELVSSRSANDWNASGARRAMGA
jgi:eukaryotic-like serine/threonine-protein kinase